MYCILVGKLSISDCVSYFMFHCERVYTAENNNCHYFSSNKIHSNVSCSYIIKYVFDLTNLT